MAAAFVIYLGPYKHSFRRKMLTVYWPECLRERGVPLLLDDASLTMIDTDSNDDIFEQVVEVSFGPIRSVRGRLHAPSLWGRNESWNDS